MRGFDIAWNARDTVALREYVEEGAMQVLSSQGEVSEGRSAMLAAWSDYFQRFHSEYHMTAQKLWISGDLAVVVESDSITVTPVAGGDTVRSAGKGLMAFHRGSDGRWRMLATN
jgi:ketosteroid isomerase-like protein